MARQASLPPTDTSSLLLDVVDTVSFQSHQTVTMAIVLTNVFLTYAKAQQDSSSVRLG